MVAGMRDSTDNLDTARDNLDTASPLLERILEVWIFRARWLMAPFYVGLALALAALLFVFVLEIWREFPHLATTTPTHLVVIMLSLIDLSLLGNLLLIVIFAGYETFVSRMNLSASARRPAWMGSIDFSGMKLKLMGSLVAISAVVLMRAFMELADGEQVPATMLAWLVGVHLTFVASALLLAIMDFVTARTGGH